MPIDIPEHDTVSDLIGKAVRTVTEEHVSNAARERSVSLANVYAICALARAIENGFGEISDIGDALKTCAVELGAISIGQDKA
jgi:hypothetical protein